MGKFRKKPVVIEAIEYKDSSERLIELQEFMGDDVGVTYENPESPKLMIATLEGTMFASIGDYIIKGVKGEFYPCKPEIFEATYEAVEEKEPSDSKYPPHQQRVLDEHTELLRKMIDLSKFITSNPVFGNLNIAEQERMERQLLAMNAYNSVLVERINSF